MFPFKSPDFIGCYTEKSISARNKFRLLGKIGTQQKAGEFSLKRRGLRQFPGERKRSINWDLRKRKKYVIWDTERGLKRARVD